MSALRQHALEWLALCEKHGVDPDSIPDAPSSVACQAARSALEARRTASRFRPRQRQRSPDRKASRDRRRMLGGSAGMPANLRQHYTEGQRSVLCIVAGEIKHHGVCDLPIDKIAALAGVCRTSVQTALHEARRLCHVKITERPQRGRKSLTNVVEIVSREWLAWIRRGPAAHRPIGSNLPYGNGLASPTKSTARKKEAADLSIEARSAAPWPEASGRMRA